MLQFRADSRLFSFRQTRNDVLWNAFPYGGCKWVFQKESLKTFLWQGLQAIRCPPGLAFDLEKQTCDWKWAVKNCDKLTKEKKVKPLLSTDEPLCEDNKLACGDSICISKDLFCDGKKDCTDGSDENACGE